MVCSNSEGIKVSELFEGDDIDAIDGDYNKLESNPNGPKLIIRKKDEGRSPKPIAVFLKWEYYKYLESKE